MNVGGSETVYTTLEHPLDIGEEVTHTISYEVMDTFTEKKETITFLVTINVPMVVMSVEFPSERLPQTVSGYRLYKEQIDKRVEVVNVCDEKYELRCQKPKNGSKLVLEFIW